MNENLEKIENYIKLAEKTDTVIYSNQFFPVSQLNNLKYYGIKFSFKGLNEDCEKKLFIPNKILKKIVEKIKDFFYS